MFLPWKGKFKFVGRITYRMIFKNGNKRSKLIIHGANGSRSDGISVSATGLGKKTPLLVDIGASVTILGSKFISNSNRDFY